MLKNLDRKRPLGITIFALLNFIAGGFLLIFCSFIIYFLNGLYPSLTERNLVSFSSTSYTSLLFWSSTSVANGVASLVLGYGLYHGKGWAWTLCIILSIFRIGFPVVMLIGGYSVSTIPLGFAIMINMIVIGYMFKPNIKDYFGRSSLFTIR